MEDTFKKLNQDIDELRYKIEDSIDAFNKLHPTIKLELNIEQNEKELTGGRTLRLPTKVSAKIIL